jgi:hypothetical protein
VREAARARGAGGVLRRGVGLGRAAAHGRALPQLGRLGAAPTPPSNPRVALYPPRPAPAPRGVDLSEVEDPRVDVCLFCLPPHRLRTVDLRYMAELGKSVRLLGVGDGGAERDTERAAGENAQAARAQMLAAPPSPGVRSRLTAPEPSADRRSHATFQVPIVPVITKADTMTIREAQNYKQEVRNTALAGTAPLLGDPRPAGASRDRRAMRRPLPPRRCALATSFPCLTLPPPLARASFPLPPGVQPPAEPQHPGRARQDQRVPL